ncbi:unnamed protein product [Trifolium pratense]|uniref:Uncharacterized protein n=1 Tax=Trifolium pratense TaxID=57577 RepID=A0ACB0LZC6_TRIPR|nr:unnamed protein product [Trifolium pratense]
MYMGAKTSALFGYSIIFHFPLLRYKCCKLLPLFLLRNVNLSLSCNLHISVCATKGSARLCVSRKTLCTVD